MTLSVPDPVTANGDINVLDKTGLVVSLIVTDASGTVNVSAHSVFFECGSLKKQLTADGTGLKLTLTSAEIYQLEASGESTFAVVDETTTPYSILWEGLIFIRSVD